MGAERRINRVKRVENLKPEVFDRINSNRKCESGIIYLRAEAPLRRSLEYSQPFFNFENSLH